MLNRTLNHVQQAKLWYAAITTCDTLVRSIMLEVLEPDAQIAERRSHDMYGLFMHTETDHIKSIDIISKHLLEEARKTCGN